MEGRSGQRGTEVEDEEEKEKGEEEREKKHMDTGSLALFIHMPSHQMVVCVHTPEMSQPNAPHSLQITATDNKQLFTCWMRAGDETKVFLLLQQMCFRTNTCFAQNSNIKKDDYFMYSCTYFFFLSSTDATFYRAEILVTVAPRSF